MTTPSPPTPRIETERLLLREITPDDLDFLAALLADPEVMRYYPKCYTREEALAWIHRNQARYERDGHGLWLAVEKSTGLPVGQLGVVEQEVGGTRFTEVGYMLARDAWGRGLATEGARACLHYGFETLGRERMHALIRPENHPSQQVALRLGMRPGVRVVHADLLHDLWYVDRG